MIFGVKTWLIKLGTAHILLLGDVVNVSLVSIWDVNETLRITITLAVTGHLQYQRRKERAF